MSKVSIKIDGTALPVPSSYQVAFEDLDSEETKRYVTTGKMRRKRTRAELMKISLNYNLSDMPDVMKIMKMIKPQTFKAELFLANEGLIGTLEMYANKKQFNYVKIAGDYKAQSFTFDLTEV